MIDKNKLKGVILKALRPRTFNVEDILNIKEMSKFFEGLELDSLDIAELKFSIKDTFGVKIPKKEEGQFKTVKDLMVYLDKKNG